MWHLNHLSGGRRSPPAFPGTASHSDAPELTNQRGADIPRSGGPETLPHPRAPARSHTRGPLPANVANHGQARCVSPSPIGTFIDLDSTPASAEDGQANPSNRKYILDCAHNLGK